MRGSGLKELVALIKLRLYFIDVTVLRRSDFSKTVPDQIIFVVSSKVQIGKRRGVRFLRKAIKSVILITNLVGAVGAVYLPNLFVNA